MGDDDDAATETTYLTFDFPNVDVNSTEPNIGDHVKVARANVRALIKAFAYAVALNRTLAIPPSPCRCDKVWGGHDNVFKAKCRYPGADSENYLPGVCPLDHFVSPRKIKAAGGDFVPLASVPPDAARAGTRHGAVLPSQLRSAQTMDDARGKRRRLLGSLRFEFVTSRPAPAGASPGGILPRGIPLRSPNASRGCPMRARALASSHRSRVCAGGADRAPFSRALDKHHTRHRRGRAVGGRGRLDEPRKIRNSRSSHGARAPPQRQEARRGTPVARGATSRRDARSPPRRSPRRLALSSPRRRRSR